MKRFLLMIMGLAVFAATAQAEPWINYFGSTSNETPWGMFVRLPKDYGAAVLAKTPPRDFVLPESNGLGYGQDAASVFAYMDKVIYPPEGLTVYDTWIDPLRERLANIISSHSEGFAAGKRLYFQIGNEVGNPVMYRNLKDWRIAREGAGADFGEPENKGWFIEHYVEYYFVPCHFAARAEDPDGQFVEVTLASVPSIFDPNNRVFLKQLLDYRIDARVFPTGDPNAELYRGKRVADLVDYISGHYLFTSDKHFKDSNGQFTAGPDSARLAMNEIHDGLVLGNNLADGPSTSIKGYIMTEEGGNAAQASGRGSTTAAKVFARAFHWMSSRKGGVPSGVFRAGLWGWRGYLGEDGPALASIVPLDSGNIVRDANAKGMTAGELMQSIYEFIGPEDSLSEIVSIKQPAISKPPAVTGELEMYIFRNSKDDKRIAVLFPPLRSAKRFRLSGIRIARLGWSSSVEDPVKVKTTVYRPGGATEFPTTILYWPGKLVCSWGGPPITIIPGNQTAVVIFLQK